MLAGNDEERVGSDCTVVWRDDAFFTQFPLNLDTVLDYFALSPFYVPGCRNDEAKRQGVPLEALRQAHSGVEFVVAFADEPTLYVIKRQRRESLSAVHQQAFFYVLYGNVYQAPSLHACLTARADKTLHHLEAAFAQLTRDLEPLAAGQRVATRLKRPRGDGGDVERDAVKALVQPPLVSPARARTIRNVDRIVLKVLERYEVPTYE